VINLFGILVMTVMVETTLLFVVFWKTPIRAFLKASFRNRLILFRPVKERYVKIEVTKPEGSLVHVKGAGYYIINPEDVYVESKTKAPCAFVYGNHARNVNLKAAKFAQVLREAGFTYFDDLVKMRNELLKKGMRKLKIVGESVDISKAVDYFNTSEKADIIEAEIQRRTAVEIMRSLKTTAVDILKWVVPVGILVVLFALAYTIIINATGGTSTNVVYETAKVISNATTGGAGVVIR